MKQLARKKERLQDAGVRIEIIEDFEKIIDHIFEKTWCEISTHINKCTKEHHLSTEEMVLMAVILSEIAEIKRIQSLKKIKIMQKF